MASAAPVSSDSGVVMRRLMTQASSAPSTTNSAPIGSIAFQKACAGASATASGVSAHSVHGVSGRPAPRCRAISSRPTRGT